MSTYFFFEMTIIIYEEAWKKITASLFCARIERKNERISLIIIKADFMSIKRNMRR